MEDFVEILKRITFADSTMEVVLGRITRIMEYHQSGEEPPSLDYLEKSALGLLRKGVMSVNDAARVINLLTRSRMAIASVRGTLHSLHSLRGHLETKILTKVIRDLEQAAGFIEEIPTNIASFMGLQEAVGELGMAVVSLRNVLAYQSAKNIERYR